MREVKRLLKLELRLLDSRSSQVSRVKSKLNSRQNDPLESIDESRRNRESRRNNRLDSILDSRED